MKTIERNNCLVTGNQGVLEHLHTFENFPVFMGCVEEKDSSKDILADMSWWISTTSGCIQMNPVPELDLIYPSSHGSGTIGQIWKSHHIQFAEFVLKYCGNSILEIGGGHGFLANYLLDLKTEINCTLIDPNPSCSQRENLEIIKGFFPIHNGKKYTTIVHSHLFEHMLDPGSFCKTISENLDDNGYLMFSIPNLGEMFKRSYTNILNFEHTYFLSEYFASYFLELTGFNIIEKYFYLEDHSIFFAAKKIQPEIKPGLVNQYDINSKLYKTYLEYHNDLIKKINRLIENTYQKVFLFGGHAISQFLIAFGINKKSISCIIDNDSNKWGKRLNGSNLLVQSPEIIGKYDRPLVILRAGAFQEEISSQLKKINASVSIIS